MNKKRDLELLGLNDCGCEKSNIKIIAIGQRAMVICKNCGKRTNPCNTEEHAFYCWNNGFVFTPDE